MEHAKAKVDAGFEFMQKLGIEYFCFHDVDLVPEADDIKETNKRLDEITDYILEKMNATGGGARSKVWMQMKADILKQEVGRIAEAILAMVANGKANTLLDDQMEK